MKNCEESEDEEVSRSEFCECALFFRLFQQVSLGLCQDTHPDIWSNRHICKSDKVYERSEARVWVWTHTVHIGPAGPYCDTHTLISPSSVLSRIPTPTRLCGKNCSNNIVSILLVTKKSELSESEALFGSSSLSLRCLSPRFSLLSLAEKTWRKGWMTHCSLSSDVPFICMHRAAGHYTANYWPCSLL